MKRVKLEQSMAGPHGAFPAGHAIDVEDDLADHLIGTSQATLVDSLETEPPAADVDEESRPGPENEDSEEDSAIQNPKSKIQSPDPEPDPGKPGKKPKPKGP